MHSLEISFIFMRSFTECMITPFYFSFNYYFEYKKERFIKVSLQLFKSYLANRQQFVQIHTSKSNTEKVTCGVPQGSILGPLLFILCINDFSNVTDALFPIVFADDTSVYIEAKKNKSTVISTLNEELEKI